MLWVGFVGIWGVTLSGFKPYAEQSKEKQYQQHIASSPVLSLFWEKVALEEDFEPDTDLLAPTGFLFSGRSNELVSRQSLDEVNADYWIRRINRPAPPLYLLFQQPKLHWVI